MCPHSGRVVPPHRARTCHQRQRTRPACGQGALLMVRCGAGDYSFLAGSVSAPPSRAPRCGGSARRVPVAGGVVPPPPPLGEPPLCHTSASTAGALSRRLRRAPLRSAPTPFRPRRGLLGAWAACGRPRSGGARGYVGLRAGSGGCCGGAGWVCRVAGLGRVLLGRGVGRCGAAVGARCRGRLRRGRGCGGARCGASRRWRVVPCGVRRVRCVRLRRVSLAYFPRRGARRRCCGCVRCLVAAGRRGCPLCRAVRGARSGAGAGGGRVRFRLRRGRAGRRSLPCQVGPVASGRAVLVGCRFGLLGGVGVRRRARPAGAGRAVSRCRAPRVAGWRVGCGQFVAFVPVGCRSAVGTHRHCRRPLDCNQLS